MNLIDRLRAAQRAFVLGPGVVQEWDRTWGKASGDYQPAEYVDYLATSNGVYACATLRADLLASLPLRFYRADGDGVRAERTDGALVELLRRVNDHWTLNRLIRMTELSLCVWGEAFWFLERGESGRLPPREIWWGRADMVRVVPHPENYVEKFLYQPATSTKPLPFAPSEVIWLRHPNIADEYEGLANLAAARLGADVASAAGKSNYNLFKQGMQIGGVVQPPEKQTWTAEQAKALEKALGRRFRGVDKAHRWAVFRDRYEMKEMGITPKDAEFLGALNWGLEESCRAFRVPLDIMGGRRTHENVEQAMKQLWTLAILPEAAFIASELVEQLLPMFPGQADTVSFDASQIEILQEDRGEIVGQMDTLGKMGVPLNVLLNEFMPQLLPPDADGYPWGDVAWFPAMLMPAGATMSVEPIEPIEPPRTRQMLAPEYGSVEHERLWRRFQRRSDRWEEKVGGMVAGLFQRQRTSVLDRLRARGARGADDAAQDPFNLPRWIRESREEIRPILAALIDDFGDEAMDDLGGAGYGIALSFDVMEPEVLRFLEGRAQRFAVAVNETTWRQLKAALNEGIADGESMAELAEQVEFVMAGRIRSSKEAIARTEVNGAANGGTLEAWRQTSGVVAGKRWLSALVPTTRPSHQAAHGQVVPLDADFHVGGGSGPHPGAIGLAGEDINCLCSMTSVLDIEAAALEGPPMERPLDPLQFSDRDAADQWLTQNGGINPRLSDAEDMTLGDYKGERYFDLNQELRDGNDTDDEVGIMDRIFSRSRLDEPVITYRGADWNVFDEDEDFTGTVFSDRSYASTSLMERTAARHADGIVMEIHVPEGAQAINMERWGWAGGTSESELLLPRDSSFEVISDNIADDPDVRRLILRLILGSRSLHGQQHVRRKDIKETRPRRAARFIWRQGDIIVRRKGK